MNSSPIKPFSALGLWLVVLFVAALAVLHLPYPFGQDQATFTWGGKALTEGAVLYRDFWDMKQPGIYWWYEASGRLFGFDSFGIRWMDLCWAVVVAPILWAAVRPRGELAAVLAACLSFGAFYAKAGYFELSQVEWLIGGPLAVALWSLGSERPANDTHGTSWRYALVGVMVTVIGVFKVMEALLPLSMAAVAMAHSRWRQGYGWRVLALEQAVPLFLGIVLSALPIALWMLLDGTLSGALWTAFVYPPEALREYQRHPLIHLVWGLSWYSKGNLWLAPWAIWAAYQGVRRGSRLELLCLAWGLSAALIISMQLLSYWQYHFDLLFIPLGVLAALGFCDVLARLKQGGSVVLRRCAIAAMAVSVIASIGFPLIRKTEQFARAIPFSPERVRAFQDEVDDRFAVYRASAETVQRLSKPTDRIVVWGDQRIYFVVEREPVLQVNGNTRFLARKLDDAVEYIRKTKPPLVYMGKGRDDLTLHGGGVLPKIVEELYTPCYEDREGTWYRLRSPSNS